MNQQTSSTNSVSYKRIQRCGNCGELGHNKRSCKLKVEVKEDIKPLINHEDCKISNYKKLISKETHGTQLEELQKIENNYHGEIISQVFEKDFLDDTRFVTIDDFKKHFVKESLEKDYNIYNLWYKNQEELAIDIISYLIKYPGTYHFPVTAPCGSGKTMLIDCMSRNLMAMALEHHTNLISINNIFVFTGYSSKDWIKDMKKDLKIIKSENVFHRDTIKNLKELIIKDNKRLLNAVFYIDRKSVV